MHVVGIELGEREPRVCEQQVRVVEASLNGSDGRSAGQGETRRLRAAAFATLAGTLAGTLEQGGASFACSIIACEQYNMFWQVSF